ncbi:MAG: transglutaminase domain-containing protein, partial [Mucinivorans sp.]
KTHLVMRQASNEISVIGAINPEEKYVAQGATAAAPLLATTGRGYFVVAMIEAKKEPTTHFLRALGTQKAMLEKWGRPIVLILSSKEQLASLNLKDFPELPSTVSFGYDENKAMSKMIGSMCEIKDMNSLPVVVLGDSFGRVVYISTGYNTSLGEQMAATIKML